ncbi:MAG: 2,5-diamino-6-(ribosylamino)-4(3H)-pyrimidinone 5'-phosphate reductase [Heterodermia speciosa]|uniref:2,5-diamino-6-ribosylamino-4(3H)-pyrimidinone 5'-phosphate reductase n=1 Tax=Heterodermia speciosa TaxID=116794 RepID=A0A8H3IHJ7_9LECA|nr:MAG: 2,5-diamino-6-(ribosylamino)-4(3H)-pyrimidinone 5'-phosphate reductase [Heterodermia speciosa]
MDDIGQYAPAEDANAQFGPIDPGAESTVAESSNSINGPNGTDTPKYPTPTRSLVHLRQPPPRLAEMRTRLFELKEKIELRVEEFELYWPYVDNVWVRQHRANADKSGRVITDYYACRLQRPTYNPSKGLRPEGKPARKKQIRQGGTCQKRLKTVHHNGGYTGITIIPVGDQDEHTHDLDHIDEVKRTSVLMDIARSEVMRGYMPASVFTVMNEDPEKLAMSGGRHLNRNDVRNASQAWRQHYKAELRVHEGYKYDHGNGIVRQDFIDPTLTNNFTDIIDAAMSGPSPLPPNTLRFPEELQAMLEPYLPPKGLAVDPSGLQLPHVTLTYATSMDSCLTLAPGLQTILSGPESKAMTHFLRSRHDAILIGVGTATADDPGLNCRLEGVGGFGGIGWEGQPRPVIIDPGARWVVTPESRILKTVHEGKGRGPWIIIATGFAMDPMRLEMLKFYGGKYLGLTEFDNRHRLRWEAILKALSAEGIRSVMIEGGGKVINDLLLPNHSHLVNSAVVTIAPTYLGREGLLVSPAPKHDESGRPQPVLRFKNVKWQPMGEDIVMCAKVRDEDVEK